ncbi:MAG: hypothetical protein EOP84_23805, partial [Verrucomicrobiaceae bacterium]
MWRSLQRLRHVEEKDVLSSQCSVLSDRPATYSCTANQSPALNTQHSTIHFQRRSLSLQLAGIVAAFAAGLMAASAQETVRSSMAGEAAAAGRRKALNSDYNVRLGP